MIDTKQNSLLRKLQVDSSNNYTITEQTCIRVKRSTKLARWIIIFSVNLNEQDFRVVILLVTTTIMADVVPQKDHSNITNAAIITVVFPQSLNKKV